MALRDLVEGDCGGPTPLIRLTSHFIKDHGLKEEGIRDIFGSVGSFDRSNPDHLVEQFLQETSAPPQTFKMESLLQEMRDIDSNIHAPIRAPGIVQELTNQDTAWANQYLQSGGHFQENHRDDIWNDKTIDSHAKVSFPGETHELGLGPKWAQEYLEQSIDQPFAAAAESENPDFAYSKFMKFMRQEGNIPNQAVSSSKVLTNDKWASQFKEIEFENSSKSTTRESLLEDAAVLSTIDEQAAVTGNWLEEFEKFKSGENQEAEPLESFWPNLQREWEKYMPDTLSKDHPWVSEYDKFYDPFKEYQFNEDNPMTSLSNPMEEGKQRLENGDLPGAILCFEAVVQQDPQNSEGWLYLGKTQAENEQDPSAITALKQCLTLDPNNLTALMALAVSYTNESYANQACLTLRDWLLRNEKYKHLQSTKTVESQQKHNGVSTILFNDVHEEVKDLFIQAARMQPHDTIDADVQSGLGVLFNLSDDYEKATDCFRSAIQARPRDPMLWNRLGAILANSQRSEEAIEAYHRALELSPGFIRARYNLGISCINLNAYKEAGEHLLTALNQQAAGRGAAGESSLNRVMSTSIWSTLRLVVTCMEKHHLVDAIIARDLRKLNKEFEME